VYQSHSYVSSACKQEAVSTSAIRKVSIVIFSYCTNVGHCVLYNILIVSKESNRSSRFLYRRVRLLKSRFRSQCTPFAKRSPRYNSKREYWNETLSFPWGSEFESNNYTPSAWN